MTAGAAHDPPEVCRLAHVPGAEAYAFALGQPFVGAHHRLMLAAHRHAPEMVLTAGALAAAAGYPTWRWANQHDGRLGRGVAILLDLAPGRYAKGPLWTTALAEGFHAGTGRSRRFCWRLYPEVAESIDRLGIA